MLNEQLNFFNEHLKKGNAPLKEKKNSTKNLLIVCQESNVKWYFLVEVRSCRRIWRLLPIFGGCEPAFSALMRCRI